MIPVDPAVESPPITFELMSSNNPLRQSPSTERRASNPWSPLPAVGDTPNPRFPINVKL